MKPFSLTILVAATLGLATSSVRADQADSATFRPGKVWLDAAGKPINAHGGCVIFHQGLYYWYGTHKIEGLSEKTHADGGVHAYASRDLVRWHDQGIVLPIDQAETRDLTPGCNFDRPKVVHNEKTGRFVLFFKFYPRGSGTQVGFVGVASSRSPSGPFTYHHKFLGGNSPEGSGDFAMFKEDDGSLYHLAVRKPDKSFVVGKMRDDYLLPEGPYHDAEGVPHATEAPAVFKREGRYWMLASGSTGWAPNPARALSADSILGPWTAHGNPCSGVNPHNKLGAELSFGGQSACIVEVHGRKNAAIAFFDVNRPEHPYESLYIWLPIGFENGRMSIPWRDEWSIDRFAAGDGVPEP
jgi:beta-xylosidase